MLTREYVEKMRKSGDIPTVNLKIFDSIYSLPFSQFVVDHENDTEELYTHYINDVLELKDDDLISYLNAIKSVEIVDNQSLEKEDSFLMNLYMQTERTNAIDFLINNGVTLNRDAFINAHKLILKGTSSQKFSDKDHRIDNEAFVVRVENGNPMIRYFALPYTDIEEAIKKIMEFYNSDTYDDRIFLKSQIIHGLVASLQLFDDGNTRYARILQNLKLSELTNKKYNYNLPLPALYGTRAYFPHRSKYRELISNLAINPNYENWDAWFNFNLNRTEDAIFFIDNKLTAYKKMIYRK